MAENKLERGALLWLVAALLLGCGEEEDPGLVSGAPPRFPIPGCEHESYALCDIRDSACQESHLSLVACVRGSERGELPPITTLTPEQYAEQLNQEIAAEPPPDPNHWERALTALGLVEPGAFSPTIAVAREVENVAGYYRPEERDIVVIDRGEGMDTLGTNLTLMHEFLHLLQGRDVDLPAFFEQHALSFDTLLAARSLVEGEAELHETRLAVSLLGLDLTALDFREHLGNAIQLSDVWMLAEPSPYSAAYYSFPYAYGARYVNHAWEASGLPGVLELYAAPPSSTLAVMASSDGIVTPAPPLDLAPIEPPAELTLVHETSLGALGIYLFMRRDTRAAELSRVWAGDRLSVYNDDAQNTILVWEVACADEASAASIEDSFFTTVWPSRFVGRSESGVVLSLSNAVGADLSWATLP